MIGQLFLRLLWALPLGLHDLGLRLTGYRLVNYHPVDQDGQRPACLKVERW